MEGDVKNIVSFKSKEQANFYFNIGNFGRAFAHLLVCLQLKPEWKTILKEQFSSTLCAWGKQLESQERFGDLFNCYEQAIEIFPENEEIFCNLGAHLFRLGHLCEAAHYFRQSLEFNKNYLPAYRNLQNVSNALVERWHFRMLNDTYRNEAYREAILKKVHQGFTSILDIGTGTGLLSLYAANSGAKDIHACDYSPTMCAIAQGVLQANKMADKVTLINKLSNNLTVPDDLPHRKSLVVTETMDSALLGENLLQTLLHAWDKLLKPSCPQLLSDLNSETTILEHGVVLPFGAKLWAAPIQCHAIARRSFLVHNSDNPWIIKKLWFYSDVSEPYDTENLRNVDCKFLSDPSEVFQFDFNSPSQLKEYYDGEHDNKTISFHYEGNADALAVWFDVFLDEDITISSSPFSSNKQCCWDQAVFSFSKPLPSVKVKAHCGKGLVRFDVPHVRTAENDKELNTCSTPSGKTSVSEIAVDKEVISFLNNKKLMDILFKLPENFDQVNNVLDLSPFPILGLRFVQLKNAHLFCVVKTIKEQKAVKEFMNNYDIDQDKVKCLQIEELEDVLSLSCAKFDFIFNYLFDQSGELKENNVNCILRLQKALAPAGVLAPVNIAVMCQLIDCEWISSISSVTNEELIETFRISEFINVYKVHQQLDVDLQRVKHSCLSEETICLHLVQEDLTSNSCITKDITLTVTKDGLLSAIPLWYHYQLSAHNQPLSTLSFESHVNQIVFTVDPPQNVKVGQSLVVNVTSNFGILRLNLVL